MKTRKDFLSSFFVAAGLETAAFISWLAEADPMFTACILAGGVAADLYGVSRLFKLYNESKDLPGFIVNLDIPVISDHMRKKTC